MQQTATMGDVDADRDITTYVEDTPGDLGKEEQESRFVLLRAKGKSCARIAKELGVSKGTLVNWNAELEAEITQARNVELEAPQEEFFLLKEGRIRFLGEQIGTFETVDSTNAA